MGPIHELLSIGLRISLATLTTKLMIPQNLMPYDIFMLGEGYHNNHHAEGGMANFARKWYEIDPVYPIIRIMDWVGLIKINPLALRN